MHVKIWFHISALLPRGQLDKVRIDVARRKQEEMYYGQFKYTPEINKVCARWRCYDPHKLIIIREFLSHGLRRLFIS